MGKFKIKMTRKLTQEELAFEQQKVQFKKRMDAMRLEVQEMELRACYHRAEAEVMRYSLEVDQLRPKYQALLAEQKKQQEEAMKRFQEQIAEMNKQAESNKVIKGNEEFLGSVNPLEQEATLDTLTNG